MAKNTPYFVRLGVENGLAKNTVYCILQDRQGFMWFGTKDGLSRYDGYQFRNYRYEKGNPNSIGNNCIRSLSQDLDGKIWVGTDMGAYIYDPNKDDFEHFGVQTKDGIKIEKEVNDIKQDQSGIYWFAVDWQGVFSYNPKNKELVFHNLNTIVNAWCIYIDKENRVWIGTHGGGASYYDVAKGRFKKASNLFRNSIDKNEDDVYRIFQDNYNDLIITTANAGVKRLNLTNNTLQQILPLSNLSSLFIRDAIRKSDTELWFATGNGICIYDSKDENVSFLTHSYFDLYSLSDNAIYSICKDREGGVWVGTYFGGVNYYPYQYTPFNKYYPIMDKEDDKTVRGRRIREFELATNGRIWIGTEDEGLNLFDPQKKSFEHFYPDGSPASISFNNVHGLLADGDKLWIGTYSHGLNIMDVNTKKVIKRYVTTKDTNSISDNSIFAIYKDHSQRIWIGTLYGLCYYNPASGDFTRVSSLGNIFVNDILQTKDGLIWVGTLGGGLYRFNPDSNEWKIFKNDSEDLTSLSHNKVISLFEDSKSTLWVTTEGGGVCKYNKDKANFTSYTTSNGLPNNVVYSIVEDNNSNLWMTTNLGIACMSMIDYTIKQYTKSDGLLSNQFNYKSGIKDASGNIYFGGLEGFISFNPAFFIANQHEPTVYITQFELFNSVVKLGDKDSPLKVAIEHTKRIDLSSHQSTFSFSFAALSYVAPEKNEYAYMLEGFDKDWIYTNKIPKASYSNIPSGKYTFKVKATNNNGIWNNTATSIDIYIHSPFYKTTIAYIVYLIIIAGGFTFFFISYKKKMAKKNKRMQEKLQQTTANEIHNAKIEFFTNITHEIRTPLSLIKGPLEYIIKEKVNPIERNEYLTVIEKNVNRLLDLSNQLLDFRKTEQAGSRLNFTVIDITELINDVYDRFSPSIIRQNLKFEMNLPSGTFFADVNKETLIKILSNLFNNALKYAKSDIRLKMEISPESFQITICNDGSIIKDYQREKIFEPFFQIDNRDHGKLISGTGLGLPLARSLAELHRGSLVYKIVDTDLNGFQLTLPIKQETAIKLKNNLYFEETNSIPINSGKDLNIFTKYSILIVEDDEDLKTFLYNQLKSHYNTYKSTNGKEALEILDNHHVDAIVSDIAMPLMDGLQLCQEIKSNVDYSHIPVILLTAKTALMSRIEGLDAGADAYIEKPFSMEYLLAQIANLISNRNKLKEIFIHSPLVKVRSIALTKADEIFLKEATEIIHKYISDAQFNIDKLANHLNMSRSSLHRKIKAVLELTPNEFIQLVKLKNAAELIKEGGRVNEVCFIVGFSSPSYFSKVFKKQFGVSPSEWSQK